MITFLISLLSGAALMLWAIKRFGLLRELQDGENWSIGVLRGKSITDLSAQSLNVEDCMSAHQVGDVPALFVADPFLVYESNVWHMFFEVMNARSKRGEIGHATSQDSVKWHYDKVVLKEPFHLSFPHVFQNDGRYYMTPETFETGEVRLYEAAGFPYDWKYIGPLVTGKDFVDPVVVFDAGRFWLWVSTTDNQNLYLYSAGSLKEPWTEHPKSPVVKNDPKSARPAGRVVQVEGKRLRFTQVDEPEYGLKVRAFEITKLSESEYEEKECEFSPILQGSGRGWNAERMHHLDLHQANGEWIASVDGYRTMSRQEKFMFRVLVYLKDILIRLDRRLRKNT